jgi:hypothetical protein
MDTVTLSIITLRIMTFSITIEKPILNIIILGITVLDTAMQGVVYAECRK